MFNSASNNLKGLLNKASELTIKTEQSIIVLSLKGNSIVTEVYESASLKKVSYHAMGSVKELGLVFEELGLCLVQVIKKVMVVKLFDKDKPLLIEYKPINKEKTGKYTIKSPS